MICRQALSEAFLPGGLDHSSGGSSPAEGIWKQPGPKPFTHNVSVETLLAATQTHFKTLRSFQEGRTFLMLVGP